MIENFLKTSTGGHQFSELTKRKLAIILYPIWTIGLVLTVVLTADGIKAIPLYNKAKALIPKQNEIENDVRNRYAHQSTGISSTYSFDPSPRIEIGIENPTPYSTLMPQRAMEIQKREMYKCFSPLIYFLLFFLLPFIILRLTYWVKSADKDVKI